MQSWIQKRGNTPDPCPDSQSSERRDQRDTGLLRITRKKTVPPCWSSNKQHSESGIFHSSFLSTLLDMSMIVLFEMCIGWIWAFYTSVTPFDATSTIMMDPSLQWSIALCNVRYLHWFSTSMRGSTRIALLITHSKLKYFISAASNHRLPTQRTSSITSRCGK